MIRVRFRNFWPGFRPRASLVGEWCWAATGGYELVEALGDEADVEVCSNTSFPSLPARARAFALAKVSQPAAQRYWQAVHYGVPFRDGRARRRIWYTGENLRPPLGYDLNLSFDLDDYGGTNVYAPFWLDRVKSGLGVSYRYGLVDFQTLLRPRTAARTPERFCAAVVSNPHPLRFRAIRALERLGPVDTYGRAFGRPVADKAAVLRRYRYCIAFENDLYPGYVTEKAIDAWTAGAVPLWWGSDPAAYLNPRCLVNLASVGGIAALVECVRELERDQAAWTAMAAEPFLLKPFDHGRVVGAIKDVLGG
jgi:Glycosyltransferase family 10 (fucosyltransferase) C-term